MGTTYWLDSFTVESWTRFLAHGGHVTGFIDSKWPAVQHMRTGDLLLCYLRDSSRWVGVLEVTGLAFHDETRLTEAEGHPSRVPVKVVVELRPEYGLPVAAMRDELSVFEYPDNWSLAFRDCPALWRPSDGAAVVAAIMVAETDPLDPLSAPEADRAVDPKDAVARVVCIHNADPGIAHRGECFGYDPFRPQKSTRVTLRHHRRGYICVVKGKTIDRGSFVQLAILMAQAKVAQGAATA